MPSYSRLARLLLFCVLAAAGSPGCTPGADLPKLTAYNGAIYRLDVGDKVRIITYGEQQLSETFSIGDGGDFDLPLLGAVHAAGLTSAELGAEIMRELKARDLFRKPSVAVEIVAYRPITVLGEVAKPGQYPYQPGMTLLTAVGVAGGFTYRSVEDRAYTVRKVGDKPVIGILTPQDYVQPGDVIKIYERFF